MRRLRFCWQSCVTGGASLSSKLGERRERVMSPFEHFETAVRQYFKPMAEKLTLQFGRCEAHLFVLYAADISVHVYFFEPHSTPGYDVVVGIAPKHESGWNPPG